MRMAARPFLAFLAMFASLLGDVALAQSPGDDFARKQNDKAMAERLARLKQATPNQQVEPDGIAGLVASQADGPCFTISRVVIDGVTKISSEEIGTLTKPYDNSCIRVDDISVLLKAVTNLYLDKGFVTSRAYVPPQDIAGSRLLNMTVVEGTISEIYLNGKRTNRHSSLATAFPGIAGQPANIRDIEQGLDQINRLSSNDAKTTMLPGSEQGTSILNVENKPSKRWHLTLANNNLGQQSTGYSQSSASLALDDLLGLNDQFAVTYGHSGPDYPWNSDGDGFSNSYSVNASIPYGYWTVSAHGSWYEYHSTVPGNFGPIETSGNSAQFGAEVERVVNRDKDSITTLRGGINHKRTNNFLLGNRIEVGSRAYTVGTIGLSHSRRMLGGVLAFELNLDQGLDLFDAVQSGEPGAGTAEPRFSKLGFTISGTRPFELSGERFELTSLLSGQYSSDNLFGAEQIALGGHSNVRGIRQSVIFGNNGLFSHNELSWRTNAFEGSEVASILGEFRPYVGADIGQVFSQSRFDIDGGHLASWSVGAKLVGGSLSADFGYSQTFLSSVDEGRANLFFASATVRW